MSQDRLTIGRALREHWPEYLMEVWGLGTFMVSAGLFATLLEYPGSPVREAIENADLRRGLPILISFSRSVGSDQYSASYDSVNVR